MFEVRTLGSIYVRDLATGRLLPLAQQPKCLALLLFLAIEPRPVLRSRALAMFWPEAPTAPACTALRQLLHRLRRALGADSIRDEGRTALALSPGIVHCDVVTVREALAAGNARAAFAAYGGEFLPGFYVSGAPDFEQWSAELRKELIRGVAAVAWNAARDAERSGDFPAARYWAERALSLMPYEEQHFREYLRLLQRCGEAVGAIAAYHDFAARLRTELELEPSEATQQLVRALAAHASTGRRRASG